MNRRRLKFLVRLSFAGVIGLVGIAAFVFLGRAMASITRDEDATEVFNEAATLPSDLRGSVEWLPDATDLPRPMEPITRDLIADAWLRGWSQFAIVAENGDAVGLTEYFSNSAKRALVDARPGWRGLPMHQIGHELKLEFYSEDGSVAAMSSASSKFLRRLPTTTDEVVWFDADETFDVVLLLEDGNWRMQHLVRRSADGVWWSHRPAAATNALPADIVALDYLPQDVAAHELFAAKSVEGPAFEEAAFEADMERMQDLGVTTIRVPLNFEAVGGRRITAAALTRVGTLLNAAEEADLSVIISLFDGRTDHRVLNWDADDDHLAVVVEELGDHPALLMWELQHDVDLTVGVQDVDRTIVDAWVGHVARTLRRYDDDTPTTISWSTARAAIEAPRFVDVITFESPPDPAALSELIADVRTEHGDVPLLIDGPDTHTWNSIFPGGSTAKEQTATTADLLNEIRANDLAGTVIGPLWDLTEPPEGSGPLPWATGPTITAGMVTATGKEKPAAALIGANKDFLAVAQPTLADGMRKPFNLILLLLCIGILVLWGLFRWRGKGDRRESSTSINSSEEIDLQSQKKQVKDSAAAAIGSETVTPNKPSSENSSPDKPASESSLPGVPPPPPGIVPGMPVVSRPAPTPEALKKVSSAAAEGPPTTATNPMMKPPMMKPPTLKPPVLETPPLPSANSGIAPADLAAPMKPAQSIKPPTITPPSIKPPMIKSPTAASAPLAAPPLAAPTIVPPPVPPAISGIAPPPLSGAPSADKKLVPSPKARTGATPTPPAVPAPAPAAKQPPAAPTTPTPAAKQPPAAPTVPAPAAKQPPAAPATPVAPDNKAAAPTVDLPAGVPTPKFVPPATKIEEPSPPQPIITAPAAKVTPPAPDLKPPVVPPTPTPAVKADVAAPSPMRPPVMKPPKMVRAEPEAAAPTVTPPSTPVGPPPMAAVIPPATASVAAAPAVAPSAPQAPTGVIVDLANLGQVIMAHGDNFLQRSGAALTPVPFLERAICDALLNYPVVNGNQPKIHLAVQLATADAPGIISDADYKTLRILALETTFPGQPEVAPTFTVIEGRPSRSAVDTMPTALGLSFYVDAADDSRISLVSKTPAAVSPTDTAAFLQRVKSTLETHDWHGEMN